MSENVESAPATPVAEAPVAAPAPVSVPVSSAKRMEAALAELGKSSAELNAVEEAPVAEKKAEVAPPVEEKKVEAPKNEAVGAPTGFEKLAKEKAALRAERDALKPYAEAAKAIPPNTLAQITAAKAANNPLAALQAMGFTPQALIHHMQAEQAAKKAEQAEPTQYANLPPEFLKKMEELESVKARFEAQEAAKTQEQVISGVREYLPANSKLSKVAGSELAVMEMLQRFQAEHGELPGENWAESVRLASEEVEKTFAIQAERFRPFLTMQNTPSTVSKEAPSESNQRGQVNSVKTLTNSNTGAPAPVPPKYKTSAERLQALFADPSIEL